MKVNRYSQVNASNYNPMSLDEIMMIPLLKRKQHDEMLNGIAESKAGLASIDYDDMYADAAGKEKARLEQLLNAQVEEAATNGISQSLRSDFMNLSSEYQKSIGPKGSLGSIEAASKSIKDNRDQFVANSTAMKHDPRAVNANFEDSLAEYKRQYAETGVVRPMDLMHAPTYENLEDDIYKFKDLPANITTSSGDQGYSIEYDYDTNMFVARTSDGIKLTETNNEQVDKLLNFMTTKYGTPGATGYESLKFNRQDPSVAADMIGSLLGAQRYKKETDTRQSRYQFFNMNSTNGRVDPNKENNNVLYEDVQETVESDYSTRSYEANGKLIQELRATPESDPNYQENIQRARRLEYYHGAIEVEAINNETYQNYEGAINGILQAAEDPALASLAKATAEGKYTIKLDPETEGIIIYERGSVRSQKIPAEQKDQFLQMQERIKEIKDKQTKMLDNYVQNQTVDYVGYVVDRRADTNANWTQHESQIMHLISSAGTVSNDYKIDSFYTPVIGDGAKISPVNEYGNSSDKIQRAIFGALGSAGNGKIVRQYIEGSTGEPMVEIAFTPAEDIELDGSRTFNDDDLKKGSQVVMRVSLGNFEGEDVSNVQNLYLTSLEQYGGDKGVMLAETMRNSARFKNVVPSIHGDDFTQSDVIKKHANFFEQTDAPVNIIKTVPTQGVVKSSDKRFDRTNKPTYMFTTEVNGEVTPVMWGHVFNAQNLADEGDDSMITDRMYKTFIDFFVANNTQGITRDKLVTMNRTNPKEINQMMATFLEQNGHIPMEFVTKEQALLTFKLQ